ncbi:hypothetical protein HPB48_005083 [Haemaphysalis longicornis]|uniref:Uncharacterized protein n=1 Tax=Haemaphysalis longicornis TaxID=44386 RepID=A0A9J6FIQ5_HAELO|nr:hypothetical protein HPB48_005083 [Haemaphysalis longicornis]
MAVLTADLIRDQGCAAEGSTGPRDDEEKSALSAQATSRVRRGTSAASFCLLPDGAGKRARRTCAGGKQAAEHAPKTDVPRAHSFNAGPRRYATPALVSQRARAAAKYNQ